MSQRREENEISQLDTRPAYRGGGYGLPNISQHAPRAPRTGPARRRIEFLSAFVPGDSIIDIWIEVNDTRVSQITPGTPFDIKANFTAVNIAGGVIKAWSCAITVVDETGQILNWNRWDTGLSLFANDISRARAKINKLGQNFMPNNNVNLRVKRWGNDAKTPIPLFPPESEW